MQRVNEIMSHDVVQVAPTDSIQYAAELMSRFDIGALPVCQHHQIVGIITDRDLTVRALAAGRGPDTPVSEVASQPVQWCFDDDYVAAIQQQMGSAQLRRLPVISRDQELIGMLSIGDIATRCDEISRDVIATTIERISQPRQQ